MNRLSIGVLASSVLVLAASAAMGQATSPFSPEAEPDIARGAELYVKVGCYQCHGYAAHGGDAPMLGPEVMPAFALAAYIRNPTGVMPPYDASVLSDADVADIAAWLRTVPASPDAASIDILPRASQIPDPRDPS